MTSFTRADADELLIEASDNIVASMQWHTTTEGHEYWQTVRNRLLELSKEAKEKRSCKDELDELRARIAELEKRC